MILYIINNINNMIIPININQKILTIVLKYKIENNQFVFEVSENNSNYILDKINDFILLPCMNTFFCLDYLKINLIDKKFVLNIFEFNNKKYIVSDYFFHLISFSEINFELNFYTNLVNQLTITENNTNRDFKLITWKELKNHKFIESLCEYLKNYKPLDVDNFNLNYTIFFLYLNPIYTNKNIKANKFNNFPKKIIQNGNSLKREKFSYLESDLFSLEEHYSFLTNNINFNNYSNHYFYLFKNDKFKKIKLIKIKNKMVNCFIDDNEIIITDIKLSVYPSLNIKITWEKIISFYIIKLTKNLTIINSINNIKEYISNYTFPLRYDKKKLDINFEKIIFFFLQNLNNEDIIKIDEKEKIHYSEEIEKLLSTKIKTKLHLLLNNLLKILYKSKNNNYDKIIFNSKIYNEPLLFEVLKNLLEKYYNDNYNDNNIITIFNLDKLKFYFSNIIIIKQILKNLNWKNISFNLKQLKFLIENTNLLYFKGRYNRNVFPDNFDTNIKKIIKEPLDMFKYLRSEKDFIRWIYFMDHNINNIYLNQIIINNNEYEILGEILYRFSILKEQNLKNNEYLYLLKICKNNKHLVLFNNRVNIKLKEYFIKSNVLNLGFLAKHLNWEKDIDISLEDLSNDTIEKLQNFNNLSLDDLKKQLIIINKKYNKYKGKYIKLKTLTETNSTQNLIY
jgi:hypothetical protein